MSGPLRALCVPPCSASGTAGPSISRDAAKSMFRLLQVVWTLPSHAFHPEPGHLSAFGLKEQKPAPTYLAKTGLYESSLGRLKARRRGPRPGDTKQLLPPRPSASPASPRRPALSVHTAPPGFQAYCESKMTVVLVTQGHRTHFGKHCPSKSPSRGEQDFSLIAASPEAGTGPSLYRSSAHLCGRIRLVQLRTHTSSALYAVRLGPV